MTIPDPAVEIASAEITANRIQQLMDQKGITLEDFAYRVGKSSRHLWRMANNGPDANVPSLLLALRIAAVLGEPLETVFSWKVKTRPVSDRTPDSVRPRRVRGKKASAA